MEFEIATQAMEFSSPGAEEELMSRQLQESVLKVVSVDDDTRDLEGTSFTLHTGVNRIGRSFECDITIKSKTLSREHACIETGDGTHLIWDQNSQNRTYRKDILLKPEVRYELNDGDLLKFGKIVCSYQIRKQKASQQIESLESMDRIQGSDVDSNESEDILDGGNGDNGAYLPQSQFFQSLPDQGVPNSVGSSPDKGSHPPMKTGSEDSLSSNCIIPDSQAPMDATPEAPCKLNRRSTEELISDGLYRTLSKDDDSLNTVNETVDTSASFANTIITRPCDTGQNSAMDISNVSQRSPQELTETAAVDSGMKELWTSSHSDKSPLPVPLSESEQPTQPCSNNESSSGDSKTAPHRTQLFSDESPQPVPLSESEQLTQPCSNNESSSGDSKAGPHPTQLFSDESPQPVPLSESEQPTQPCSNNESSANPTTPQPCTTESPPQPVPLGESEQPTQPCTNSESTSADSLSQQLTQPCTDESPPAPSQPCTDEPPPAPSHQRTEEPPSAPSQPCSDEPPPAPKQPCTNESPLPVPHSEFEQPTQPCTRQEAAAPPTAALVEQPHRNSSHQSIQPPLDDELCTSGVHSQLSSVPSVMDLATQPCQVDSSGTVSPTQPCIADSSDDSRVEPARRGRGSRGRGRGGRGGRRKGGTDAVVGVLPETTSRGRGGRRRGRGRGAKGLDDSQGSTGSPRGRGRGAKGLDNSQGSTGAPRGRGRGAKGLDISQGSTGAPRGRGRGVKGLGDSQGSNGTPRGRGRGRGRGGKVSDDSQDSDGIVGGRGRGTKVSNGLAGGLASKVLDDSKGANSSPRGHGTDAKGLDDSQGSNGAPRGRGRGRGRGGRGRGTIKVEDSSLVSSVSSDNVSQGEESSPSPRGRGRGRGGRGRGRGNKVQLTLESTQPCQDSLDSDDVGFVVGIGVSVGPLEISTQPERGRGRGGRGGRGGRRRKMKVVEDAEVVNRIQQHVSFMLEQQMMSPNGSQSPTFSSTPKVEAAPPLMESLRIPVVEPPPNPSVPSTSESPASPTAAQPVPFTQMNGVAEHHPGGRTRGTRGRAKTRGRQNHQNLQTEIKQEEPDSLPSSEPSSPIRGRGAGRARSPIKTRGTGRGGRGRAVVDIKEQTSESAAPNTDPDECEQSESSSKRGRGGRGSRAGRVAARSRGGARARAGEPGLKRPPRIDDGDEEIAPKKMKSEEEGDLSPKQTDEAEETKTKISRKRPASEMENLKDDKEPDTDSAPTKKRHTSSTRGGRAADLPSLRANVRDSGTTDDSGRPSYRVMFTGIDDDRYKKMVVELGGIVVVSSLDATHLVTDQVRRTAKFLCCLARGLPILTPRWLTASKDKKTFTDYSEFYVTYKARDFGISSLPAHLSIAAQRPLLTGWTILCTPKVLPPPALIRDMVLCAGGIYVDTLPSREDEGGEQSIERTTVIACATDASHPLVCAARAQSIPVVSHEFLLSGIMAQKLDLKRHLLK